MTNAVLTTLSILIGLPLLIAIIVVSWALIFSATYAILEWLDLEP